MSNIFIFNLCYDEKFFFKFHLLKTEVINVQRLKSVNENFKSGKIKIKTNFKTIKFTSYILFFLLH